MGYNVQYFNNIDLQVQATVTCSELQGIFTEVTTSVNQIVSDATSQLALVETDFNNLAASITALDAQIATLTGSQAAFTAVQTQAATASGVSDLASAIAYIHAQGTVMVTLGSTNTLTFIKQAITLAQDVVNVTVAYNRLQSQITSLTELLTDIPARLTSIENAITTKAALIPNCTIT